MKDRILEFLRAENKSSAQFAEEIGVQPSGISHILSGRNNPSLDFVVKMLEKYHFLSTEWLLFGRGSMYKDSRMQTLFEESRLPNPESDKIVADNLNRSQNFEDKSEDESHAPMPESRSYSGKSEPVTRIVWFFGDNSFEEYIPR